VGFDFVSSRLGTALKSNALKQDSYRLSAHWYFQKGKALRFSTGLSVGYFQADLEEKVFNELPSTAILLSPEIGITYSFDKQPFAAKLGTGYNIDLADEGVSPGTLQPLYYHLILSYQLPFNQ
jgi:hypothetical protein